MPKTIPTNIIEAAQKAERKWGIAASISLAQWALESGYGEHTPPGSNNPFGIKAVKGQPYVSSRTREVAKDGHSYFIIAQFRKFGSIDDAFDLHARLLSNGKPYQSIRQYSKQPLVYVNKLTGLYATDPNYGHLLTSIIQSNNLIRYDNKPSPAPPLVIAATATAAPVLATVARAQGPALHAFPAIDWHVVAVGGIGLALGAASVFMWASILAYRQLKCEPIEIDETNGSEEDEMIRAEAQPIIDMVIALAAKASANQNAQTQLDEANNKIADLTSQLAASEANLSIAKAAIDTATQNDSDTDAAILAAGQPVQLPLPLTPQG